MKEYHGSCHCENFRYELSWPENTEMVGRSCDCSFCSRHGAIWSSHRSAEAKIKIQNRQEIIHYRFGQRTAEFHICAVCGIVAAAVWKDKTTNLGVININTLDNAFDKYIKRVTTHFDSENRLSRETRRRASWMPMLEVTPALR